jgi:Flp pilus assembly pilin Flp
MSAVNALVARAQNAWFAFRDEDSGQTLVEYALIIAVVSLGAVAALTFLRDEIVDIFRDSGSELRDAPRT